MLVYLFVYLFMYLFIDYIVWAVIRLFLHHEIGFDNWEKKIEIGSF